VSWLDRQSFLGADSDAILGQAVVGVVGLGGGGSHVAQQLAHLGIGSLVLVDPDDMEDTNLNRLIGGTLADVEAKTPKAEIARRVVSGIRPDIRGAVIKDAWQNATDILKGCDIIVGGLDSVRAKDELDAFCRRFMIPYIDMGMDVHGTGASCMVSGQVVLSSPGNPCLRCLHIVTDQALERESEAYGDAGGLPQVVWPNGVLASTAVGLVVQLLTPWHPNPVDSAYLEYDGNLGSIVPSALLRHQARHPCIHYPANERGDPGFDVRNRPAPPPAPVPAEVTEVTFWDRVAGDLRKLFRLRGK
jgi:molybdopterin/thiamine biosynthesis adenylyltransferase